MERGILEGLQGDAEKGHTWVLPDPLAWAPLTGLNEITGPSPPAALPHLLRDPDALPPPFQAMEVEIQCLGVPQECHVPQVR